MRDLHNNINVLRAISPITLTNADTAQVGQIIDRAGYESLEFVIATGALTDTNATFTVLVEHGDAYNLAGGAAVPDAQLLGTEVAASFTFAADDAVRKIGYIGTRRYVRLTITPSGNDSGSATFGALAILGNPCLAPVA